MNDKYNSAQLGVRIFKCTCFFVAIQCTLSVLKNLSFFYIWNLPSSTTVLGCYTVHTICDKGYKCIVNLKLYDIKNLPPLIHLTMACQIKCLYMNIKSQCWYEKYVRLSFYQYTFSLFSSYLTIISDNYTCEMKKNNI